MDKFEVDDKKYYTHLHNNATKIFEEQESIVIDYLLQEYGYSEETAVKALAYLKQNKFIAVEFLYYVEHQKFFPWNYASKYCGYTAEMLSQCRFFQTTLMAFQYLVLLSNLENMNPTTVEKEEQHILTLETFGLFGTYKRHNFVGNLRSHSMFTVPFPKSIDMFGYYKKKDGTYDIFETNSADRGTQIIGIHTVQSEKEAIEYLSDYATRSNFIEILQNRFLYYFEDDKKRIINYLQTEYGYTDLKAQKALEYLLQNSRIAAEFACFVISGKFLPDEIAASCSGYSAKKLKQETNLTVLGAFNYMIYIIHNQQEALENLKKGLPRK